MKDIKVLGTGCANCKATVKIVEEVANEKGVPISLEKVEDITKLTAALKTARHEALREAAKVVETITLQAVKAELRWREKHAAEEVDGVAKSERAECHLRSLGLHIKGELDQLASEGA